MKKQADHEDFSFVNTFVPAWVVITHNLFQVIIYYLCNLLVSLQEELNIISGYIEDEE